VESESKHWPWRWSFNWAGRWNVYWPGRRCLYRPGRRNVYRPGRRNVHWSWWGTIDGPWWRNVHWSWRRAIDRPGRRNVHWPRRRAINGTWWRNVFRAHALHEQYSTVTSVHPEIGGAWPISIRRADQAVFALVKAATLFLPNRAAPWVHGYRRSACSGR
jgi:hypothetical protein